MNQVLLVTLLAGLALPKLGQPMAKAAPVDARGIQFVPFASLAGFKRSRGAQPNEVVLTSKEIHARIRADELIASWNAHLPPGSYLKVETRAWNSDHATAWYCLGLWSNEPELHPRESVRGQRDADGYVDTDTLILRKASERFQLRLTLSGENTRQSTIRFLSLSLLDTGARPAPLTPNRNAWGKTIEVPERSQMAYENGGVICSPTTISMMLAYWSLQLKQPQLDHDVPEVVKGVFDRVWGGTGNWVFNTAYAGSLPGMRAYTARLSDIAELEDFVARGIPVGLSLCYNRLRGKSREASGHLVVCVGFTETGDPVINDPGTSRNVRKVFPRANLVDAWAYSKNAAYLIYPQNAKLPKDRFGHWESPVARSWK